MSNAIPAFSGSVPENYDRYLGPYIFEPYAADLAARIDRRQVSAVLETACGTGRLTRYLRNLFPASVQLTATDLNIDMVTAGQKLYPGMQVDWQVADAQLLPFAANSFDRLICQFGLMFMPDKSKALQEALRVLQPGGQLVLNTWNSLEHNPAFKIADETVASFFPTDPPRFFHIPFSMHDKDDLQQLIADAGFRQIQIERVEKEGRSESAAATATGMIEGSPVYQAICERDASLLTVIKDALTKKLAVQFGDAPMVSPLEAWVVTAWK